MTESQNPRRPSVADGQLRFLTSLRGMAALLIVFYHVREHLEPVMPVFANTLLASGFLAVDFFFVLSGFILSWKYHTDFRRPTLASYRTFIIRRAARVVPLHVFVMFAFISVPLAHVLTGRPYDRVGFSVPSFFAKLFLIDTWGLGQADHWNVPSWSIGAEFAAYLLFPVLLLLLVRRSVAGRLALLTGICLGVALVWRVNDLGSLGARFGDFAVIRCLAEFTLGMLVFFLRQACDTLPRRVWAFSAWLSSILGAILILLGFPDYYFAPLLFTLFLGSMLQLPTSTHRALEYPALVYLGDISYSVYLNHYLIKYLMTVLFLRNDQHAGPVWIMTYVTIVIGVSVLTYHYVETAIRVGVVRHLESRRMVQAA